MVINIDQEFRNLLWPLSAVEFSHLEQSIASEGCREKLIVWQENNTLVDGHNRYEICKSLGIDFNIEPMSFASRDAVCDWIDKNQASRRNVTPEQYKIITGRIYNRRKKTQNDGGKGTPKATVDQIDPRLDSTAIDVASEMGVSAPTVKRDGKRAEVYDKLVEAGEEEAAEIVKSAPQKVIDSVAKKAPAEIAEAVKKPHISNNSGEQDWYTPVEFIESAREVLGSIDLDPASSETAQRFVNASEYFDKEQDGLKQDWCAKSVWLNPPYSSGTVEQFVEKLIESITSDSVKSAIVLVNNATETRWFQLLANHAKAICFTRGRIKFLDATGEPKQSPLQGQAFVYFGSAPKRFLKVFKLYGFCVEGIVCDK